MKIIKKLGLIVLAVFTIIIFYFGYGIFINPKSPKGNVLFKNENIKIEISYSRPYKKNRLIFGGADKKALVPFGKYWRLGANFATSIEINQNVSFAGRPLNKGKYRLYAVPFKNNWRLVINSESGVFGFNEPDYSKDIMAVNLPVNILNDELEQFTIDFVELDSILNLRMRWDNTEILSVIDY